MAKINADNERIKRAYFHYLIAAKGYDEATVDAHAKAIARFENYSGARSFKLFHREQARGFKEHLERANAKTGKPLAKSTAHQVLNALKAFFIWLAGQPGFKSRISYADADYFTPNRKQSRALASTPERPFPSVKQVEHVIASMPSDTPMDRRDRALVALTLLTGARDKALVTLRLKHIDLTEGRLIQDGRDVATKGGKSIETWFFPVGREIVAIVEAWVAELRTQLLFAETDPLFPATKVGSGPDRKFTAVGLDRRFWSSADPVRKVFKRAFEAVGLPYFNPHSLRKTLTQLGEQRCTTPEEFKALSQNLGHEHVSTTFSNYGRVAPHRQGELIRGLALREGRRGDDTEALIDRLAAKLRQHIGHDCDTRLQRDS